jgi:DNA-binding CsgD family transcriptional regulator
LAAIGLKQLLQSFLPMMVVDVFGSYAELAANYPNQYVHYFTDMNIVLENRDFFLQHRHKTIVLTISAEDNLLFPEFHSILVSVPEKELVRSLIMLEQYAHKEGRNLPPRVRNQKAHELSDREKEVMVLIVKGYINKEIADMLHIALSTVITHRKNIMEKLGLKSVSALTIYAVTNGYVDIHQI